jgi:acyl-CoA synthetase (AMP-forming)/AMP-acid ligase II
VSNIADGATLLNLLEIGSPEHPALTVPGGPTISYDSLRRQVYAAGRQLNSFGIRQGDRVGIVLPNGPEFVISFLAASAVAAAVPLNPVYTQEEFKYYLEDIGVKALIISPTSGAEAAEVIPTGGFLIIAISDAIGEVSLVSNSNRHDVHSSLAPRPEDIALILHTSGTTRRPKRVPITHANIIATVRNIRTTYHLEPGDVSVCAMPFFHVHGLVASLLSTLGSGGTAITPSRFDARVFWSMVTTHRASWYSAVPAMHQALLAWRRRKDILRIPLPGTLRFIRSCSASLSPKIMKEMERIFEIPVVEAYGMTETAHQSTSNQLPPLKRKEGTVGISTGPNVAIMNAVGSFLQPGRRGEIVIQGQNVMKGYENNPEANSSSFINGWFRTGDEGYLDQEHYLSITGRIKELISRGGEKISPQEIDEILLAHPAVVEAVSFGLPSERYGEEVFAAVVLDKEVSQGELIAYCREHLAPFKVPHELYFVSSIPKTASGKVQRRNVASQFPPK